MDNENSMGIGVVRESDANERRVVIVPKDIAKLKKAGFEVRVEKGAGAKAGFPDAAYEEAGAEVVEDAWKSDLVLKVNPPTDDEIAKIDADKSFVSMLYAARDPKRIEKLAEQKVRAFALDQIPRTTVAQAMDVLSSMANIAGYRAVLEAAHIYQGFMGSQTTAAGSTPPAKILVIGAGVAGLAAIAAGRALGAEVRAFDVRPETKDQIESLGGKFLKVELEESGSGEGGYAKTMSKEFIAAEMKLFREQAAEVNVIITTALVAGAKAPLLVPDDVVAALRPGSVIVDLAAEQGGNCSKTVAGEVVDVEGVKVVGYTDLPSRLATTASTFFSANVTRFITSLKKQDAFGLDLKAMDELAEGGQEGQIPRATVVAMAGDVIERPPRKPPSPKPAPAPEPKVMEKAKPAKPEPKPASPAQTVISALIGTGLIVLLGQVAPADFVQHFTVFVLAIFVGWQVVWAVAPALHTPLMSVTNAISGIVVVGGILQAGSGATTADGGLDLSVILGVIAVVVASVNVFGGFLVTQRMLGMFKKG